MKKLLTMFSLFLIAGALTFAQTVQITGTVTSSEDGLPLPGVAVTVVGTTIGVSTDMNGRYTLNVPVTATTLQFKFLGMITVDVPIEGRNVINVQMAEDRQALGEVIVLGYSTRGKNQITGSTVQLSAEELKQVPVTSIDQTLQGKVAGLVINTTSGTPGSEQQIRIRGVSSFSATNDPLLVIDGVPVIDANTSSSGAFSSLTTLAAINSNDIESITVLKDASATSAYGARGSNGVIVITTVKGKEGKTRYNFNASYGFQNKATEGRKELTAADRHMLWLEGIINTYGEANGFSTPEQAWTFAAANNLTGYGGVVGYRAWDEAGRPEGDWGNAVLNKNAPIYNINLSASGGEDGSSFYASLGYNNTESVVIGNLFERITGVVNVNRKLNDRMRFNTNNTISYTNQDQIFLETSAYFGNPHTLRYFMPPTFGPYNDDGSYNITRMGSLFNILYLQENNENWNHMTRGLTNNSFEWEIIDNLRFKTLVSMDFVHGHYKDYRNRIHGDSRDENGTSWATMTTRFNMVTQNSLDYRLTVNDHTVDFKALTEFQKYKYWYIDAYGESFITDGLTNVSSAGTNFDASSSFSDWAQLSYLGMANYNYQGKYIADFTFRREGSSRFPAANRFGNFWSIGAAWNMAQENFLSGVSFIDNLRLRASYGVSGNSGVSLNSYQALLSFTGDYAGQGASAPSGYGNPLLTWEKNRNYDIGIDFTLFNSRVDGSVAYFNKETFDLLQNVPLTLTSGHSSVTSNVGKMVNKGIEAIVDIGIIRTSKFNLGINFNVATLNNEVTELAKDGEGNYIRATSSSTRTIEVGHTYMEWYVQEWAGVDTETGLPTWYIDRSVNDDVTFTYTQAKRNYLGKSAIPTLTGGAGIKADFMGVYFNANFYYAGGHMVWEDWTGYFWDNGLYATSAYQGVELLLERWQKPGDGGPNARIPKIQHAYRPNQSNANSTRFMFDGDYIRLKDLVLGYNLPSSLLSRVKLSNASVYMRGTNLWTFAFDEELRKGFDPETGADGFTGLETPPIKSLVFGLNVNF